MYKISSSTTGTFLLTIPGSVYDIVRIRMVSEKSFDEPTSNSSPVDQAVLYFKIILLSRKPSTCRPCSYFLYYCTLQITLSYTKWKNYENTVSLPEEEVLAKTADQTRYERPHSITNLWSLWGLLQVSLCS